MARGHGSSLLGYWHHGGVTLAKWSLDKLDEGKYAKLQSKVSCDAHSLCFTAFNSNFIFLTFLRLVC